MLMKFRIHSVATVVALSLGTFVAWIQATPYTLVDSADVRGAGLCQKCSGITSETCGSGCVGQAAECPYDTDGTLRCKTLNNDNQCSGGTSCLVLYPHRCQ